MPREKAPAKKAGKVSSKKQPPAKMKRPRRSPIELLEDLKHRRELLAQSYDRKLNRIDGHISKIETRHQKLLELEHIKAGKTPEDLQGELGELKDRERLLRKALKSSK